MSRNQKILLCASGAVVCLLAALIALPLLFVDRIEARVRSEIERATLVRASWSDVGLGFFRDFPHLTLSLHELAVVGTNRFDGDTLAAVGDVRLALNTTSVIGAVRGRSPLVVRSIQIDQPKLRLQVDDEGVASWDVLRDREEAPESGSGRAIAVSLQSFELADGDVVLDNAQSGVFVSLEGLRHSIDGDFSRASLNARTRTHADRVTVRLGGAPYLAGASMDFDADFDVDMNARSARLTDNELRLNDLALRLNGELARDGENLAMDLTFEAPSTAFSQVLSLVSVIYAQDFASLITSGTFALNGRVQGAYGVSAFPSFALALTVADGGFRYPDVTVQAKAIAADLSITNPGGDLDSTVVSLSRFHVEIDDQPLDGSLTLRTPISDPDLDVEVLGTIDLADASRVLKLDAAGELGGVIVADARVRARLSDVDSARFEQIAADGSIAAREVTLRSPTLRQPVDIREARIELTPRTAELRSFDAQLGSSDLQATGRLDNLLGFALGQQPLSGTASVTSQRFVLDEWKSDDAVAAIPVPAMLDLTLDGRVSELVLNGVEMTSARGRAIVRDQRVTFEDIRLQTLGGRIGLDGYYETLDAARPTFAVDLELDSLDLAGASAAFLTVRRLAPVARYARGTFSSDLSLSGAVGRDLAPDFDVLDGAGSVSSSRIAIEGFPLLDRLGVVLGRDRSDRRSWDLGGKLRPPGQQNLDCGPRLGPAVASHALGADSLASGFDGINSSLLRLLYLFHNPVESLVLQPSTGALASLDLKLLGVPELQASEDVLERSDAGLRLDYAILVVRLASSS